jgi:hypothetical protein
MLEIDINSSKECAQDLLGYSFRRQLRDTTRSHLAPNFRRQFILLHNHSNNRSSSSYSPEATASKAPPGLEGIPSKSNLLHRPMEMTSSLLSKSKRSSYFPEAPPPESDPLFEGDSFLTHDGRKVCSELHAPDELEWNPW